MENRNFKEQVKDVASQALRLTDLLYEAEAHLRKRNLDEACDLYDEFDAGLAKFEEQQNRMLNESQGNPMVEDLADCFLVLLNEAAVDLEGKLRRLEKWERVWRKE